MRENARQRPWDREEILLMRNCYAFTPAEELAEALGRSLFTVYRLAKDLGLKKDPEFVKVMGRIRTSNPNHPSRAYRYPKGHQPANKGTRRPGYAPGRMAETQFKKGIATNWMPVGSTRLVDGYLYRKISDTRNVVHTRNWKLEHYLLWEREYGQIPEGHAVVFRDGDRTNVCLANLELISRADLMRRNTIHNLPEPLKEVIRLKGSIKRVVTNRRKRDAKEQAV